MEACSSGWVRRKRARGSRSPGLARRIQRPGDRWQVGSKASEGPGVLTLALALVPYPGAAVEEEDPLGQGGVSPQEGVGPGPGRHLPPGQEDGAASPFPPQSLWILAVGGGQTRTIRGPLWGRGDRTCKRVLRGQGRPQLTSEGKQGNELCLWGVRMVPVGSLGVYAGVLDLLELVRIGAPAPGGTQSVGADIWQPLGVT